MGFIMLKYSLYTQFGIERYVLHFCFSDSAEMFKKNKKTCLEPRLKTNPLSHTKYRKSFSIKLTFLARCSINNIEVPETSPVND